MTRTTRSTVKIRTAFGLAGQTDVLPSRDYIVVTRVELPRNHSATGTKQILTLFRLPQADGSMRSWTTKRSELEAALKRDGASAEN